MIAITGGGTGGHLAIARALALEFKKRGINVIFIGSINGQDRAWFANSNEFQFCYFLSSSGVVNKKGIKKILSFLNSLGLAFKCYVIFKKHSINSVISVGGYSSAPASFAAILFRKFLFIHEQNAIRGKLNSLLKPFCKHFFSSYTDKHYDYPVDEKFFKVARVRKELKTVLFLGGSQGASFINSLALKIAKILDDKSINIIHQCGKKEFDSIKSSYENLGIKATVFDFSSQIEIYMQKADICISRAGASSVWELCAATLPSIFIPYPYAANDHQFFNAKFLEDLKLAKIFRQEDIKANSFIDFILNYNIEKTSKGLKNVISNNGKQKIVDEIIKDCKILQ